MAIPIGLPVLIDFALPILFCVLNYEWFIKIVLKKGLVMSQS